MCTNRIKVTNKYVGRSFYVDCGHCPACLQRKANKSCRKIISEYGRPHSFMCFVTLSYDNDHIPYIQPDLDYTRSISEVVSKNFFGHIRKENSIY